MPPNRLIDQTSPYLLQHAHNPVDWYPWGPEALERARTEDRPILLSVGYAACHWCHVMERESFEDADTARAMNERFVCIKVDREERPDLDAIYMSAVQAMTGHGGWPMTVFLTPEGKPFWGGTYFPPEPRHGMPSFRQVLDAIHDAWVSKREGVLAQGEELTQAVARTAQLPASTDGLRDGLLDEAAAGMLQALDPEWGGFGNAPKFPQPMTLEFLLRCHVRGTPEALHAVTLTLDRMARGGIFDQVGGGFHRYSVDRIWLVPHFEKMLYDNAQLVRLYARAWLVTGSALHRETSLATAEYLLREMRHPEGGFFSAQDADSEGVEGRFYVWPFDELVSVAGQDVAAALGASAEGNWEGVNVLWRPSDGSPVPGRAREVLREAREHRARPATDDKVLAAWNGLAIAALAEAGRIFGRADLIEAAARAADFVLGALRPAGRLQRSWREGRTSGPAFLDDHAMIADACLTLYETTFEPRWWDEATALVADLRAHFAAAEGGFYDTGSDAEQPVVRPLDVFDNAVPSGNSAAADILLRMAALTGDEGLARAASGSLGRVAPIMSRAPLGSGAALSALDRSLSPRLELAIVGTPGSSQVRALARTAFGRFLPNLVVAGGEPGSTEPALLRDRRTVDGHAAAYVCSNFACRAPVSEPEALARALEGGG